MVNPATLFKLKGLQDTFVRNHPKFPAFLNALKAKGIHSGDIISITVESPSGEKLESNIKVTDSDVEAFEQLLSLMQQ